MLINSHIAILWMFGSSTVGVCTIMILEDSLNMPNDKLASTNEYGIANKKNYALRAGIQ